MFNEYRNFLTIHQAKDKQSITHTIIPDKRLNVYGASYSIPEEDLAEFYDLYYDYVFVNKKPEFLTEKQPKDDCPLLVDLDFKFHKSVEERVWTNDDIDTIIAAYCEEIDNVFDIPDGASYKVYVSQRKQPRLEDEYTKDGIHAVFSFSCPRSVQTYIRERMMKRDDIIEMIERFNITNTVDDVFDVSISRGSTNWMLFGSRKPGTAVYGITHTYNVLDGEFEYETFQMTRQTFENLLANNKNIPKFEIRKSMIDEIASQKSTPVMSPSTRQARPIVICGDNAKAFIDANCMIEKADHYSTWFPECVKIIRQFGLDANGAPTDEARELVHYFSQKSKNYTPCGPKSVDEWLDNYDDASYWESTVFPQPRPEAGVCHIKLPEEEKIIQTKTQKTYPMNPIVLNSGIKAICDAIKPELNKMLVYSKKKWLYFDTKTSLWKHTDEPTHIIITTLNLYLNWNIQDCSQRLMELAEDEIQERKQLETNRKAFFGAISAYDKPSTSSQMKKHLQEMLRDDDFDKRLDNLEGRIAFADGIYTIETDEFRSGIFYEDFLTSKLPIKYRKSTQEWKEKIKKVVFEICSQNEERERYLWRCLGYSMTGLSKQEQVAFFWVGMTAGNGKSTIISSLTKCFPEYVKELGRETFNYGNKEVHKQLADVKGKRICWCNEPGTQRKDIELIKQYADGMNINNKVLYGTTEDISITSKLFFLSNQELSFISDQGIRRRYKYNDFISKFYDSKKELLEDVEVVNEKIHYVADKKLSNELSCDEAKYAWLDLLFEGGRDYFKNGLNTPAYLTQKANETVNENNPFYEFIQSHIRRKDGKHAYTGKIEELWLKLYGKSPDSKMLKNAIRAQGYIYDSQKSFKIFGKVKKGGFIDIELIEELEETEDTINLDE